MHFDIHQGLQQLSLSAAAVSDSKFDFGEHGSEFCSLNDSHDADVWFSLQDNDDEEELLRL